MEQEEKTEPSQCLYKAFICGLSWFVPPPCRGDFSKAFLAHSEFWSQNLCWISPDFELGSMHQTSWIFVILCETFYIICFPRTCNRGICTSWRANLGLKYCTLCKCNEDKYFWGSIFTVLRETEVLVYLLHSFGLSTWTWKMSINILKPFCMPLKYNLWQCLTVQCHALIFCFDTVCLITKTFLKTNKGHHNISQILAVMYWLGEFIAPSSSFLTSVLWIIPKGCWPTSTTLWTNMKRFSGKIYQNKIKCPSSLIFFYLIIKQCSQLMDPIPVLSALIEIPPENKCCFRHITVWWSNLKMVQFKFAAVNSTAGDQVCSTQTQISLQCNVNTCCLVISYSQSRAARAT